MTAPALAAAAVVGAVLTYAVSVVRRRSEAHHASPAPAGAELGFLAHMSHEIRTTLNGVIGLTEALVDTELDDTQLRYVRMIRSSGDSLLAVIDSVLDVSTLEPEAGPAPAPRVLVAEDNHVNQVVAVALLKKLGYTAAVAQNGREAVDMCTHGDFAAVLMDCQMPQLDGFDATREIRRRESDGRRVPIIAVTADVTTNDRGVCLDAGMDDYISKPVRPGELEAALGRWVQTLRK